MSGKIKNIATWFLAIVLAGAAMEMWTLLKFFFYMLLSVNNPPTPYVSDPRALALGAIYTAIPIPLSFLLPLVISIFFYWKSKYKTAIIFLVITSLMLLYWSALWSQRF